MKETKIRITGPFESVVSVIGMIKESGKATRCKLSYFILESNDTVLTAEISFSSRKQARSILHYIVNLSTTGVFIPLNDSFLMSNGVNIQVLPQLNPTA